MAVHENGASASTLPSPGAALSSSSAIRPLAPGLFSTTAAWLGWAGPARFFPPVPPPARHGGAGTAGRKAVEDLDRPDGLGPDGQRGQGAERCGAARPVHELA